MNLFIAGGTGKTGQQLIKQALERGHTVTVLARKPKKLKIADPNLSVIKGNILVPETFEQALKGQDTVLSALGHKRYIIKTTILSMGTRNLIGAMKKHGVRRLICITSLGINDSRFKLGLYYTLFTIPVILLFYFIDKSRQEKIIRASGLDWTIIRPGQLTNGRRRLNYKHGPDVGDYLFTRMISRASVAHFMLNQLDDNTYIGKTPGIIN
jgi:uncharacterized protein YbjT (DUF2867 family)